MDVKVCNENPLQRSNFINKLFFWWLKDIIKRGKKHDLETSDIYDPIPDDLSEPLRHTLEIAWERETTRSKAKSRKPSLSRAIITTYYRAFLKYASLEILYVITLMIQPTLLKMIMLYFDPTSRMPTLAAYAYATTSIILMFLQTVLLRHGAFQLNRLGMQIKVACSSLIYKKITKLPCSLMSENNSASAISLLSVDVGRFELLLYFLAFVVIFPLQLLGVTYLVYTYVGLIASLIGVSLVILQTIPLQTLYYKLALKWRVKQITNTDKRISLIDEIVAGVRAIKMYAWENYFEKLVCQARRLEIKGFLKISYLISVADSLSLISHRISSFVVTLVYLLQHKVLTTENMLPVRQHFFNLRSNLSVYFFLGVQAIANTRVSIKRIEEFLCLPEIKPSIKKIEGHERYGAIIINDVTTSWDKKMESTTLQNISIDFLPKKLYTILGATGSGKSSLLKLILGELESCSGEVSISGKISYASQEPWLFNASIRENILFGETYEVERYDEVISACALVDDFNNLPNGDQTLVADRGISLSGGQRARINIARAVYRQADIYLLDDPFSAVDTRVAKILRSQCIDGLLNDKTVVLSGKIQFEGNVVEFQKRNKYLQRLPSEEIDIVKPTEKIDDYAISTKGDDPNVPKPKQNMILNENEEAVAKGTLSKSVFLKYAEAGGYIGLLVALVAHALPTILIFKFDYDVTVWTEGESLRNESFEYENTTNESASNSNLSNSKIPTIVFINFSILALILLTTVLKNILMYRFVYNANRNLHNNMFAHLISTSLRFFELNPAGRILNRFSEDIGNLDNALPDSLVDMLKTAFHVGGSLIFVLIINWWNIGPIALTGLLFVKMSCIYVAAVPKIKRLVGTAKSPVLNYVTSTLAGLTTIRSCKAEHFVMKEFASLLDKHTAVFFLVLASSMAFAIWIEILTVGLFACTAYICIALKSSGILGGEAGLILMTIYEIISSVSYMVRVFADTCAHMVSVERILQYTELEPEYVDRKEETNHELKTWPSRGDVRFEQVNLRYSDKDEPVLKNISVFIEAGTKVGIVGRTGAGKSSLLTALFRLAKVDGQLFVGGVNTQTVDLYHLRSKISIIPQEPILFSATLRHNLDPLNEFDDEILWSALDSVGLKKIFLSLDQPIVKAGKNLSAGQRQLLCLARVAIKNNKILVLDEATANIDSATDALIQKTIKEKFKSCTVLTIAHRLNTIMDSDKVLVMNHGQIAEYDHPHVLLQNRDGHFSKMVEQTGEGMSQQLRTIAENAYDLLKVESTYC